MADNKDKTPEQIIKELQAQLAAKDTELTAQNAIIAGQNEQLQAAEASATEGRPVVTHNKKLYRVVAKQFSVDGIEDPIKAVELKDKPELVKKLVDAKSGVLVLITKEEAAAE